MCWKYQWRIFPSARTAEYNAYCSEQWSTRGSHLTRSIGMNDCLETVTNPLLVAVGDELWIIINAEDTSKLGTVQSVESLPTVTPWEYIGNINCIGVGKFYSKLQTGECTHFLDTKTSLVETLMELVGHTDILKIYYKL